MAGLTCKHCGQEFEAIADLAQCPHCAQDVSVEVMATLRPEEPTPKMSKSLESTDDSAKTAMAGMAPVPEDSLEKIVGESSRTLDGAGQSPNLGDFRGTLKPSDSAFESIDLASAIPPRAIATDDTPGEAKDYRLGRKLGSGSFGVVYQAEQIPLERTVALKMLKARGKAEEGLSEETKAKIKSQRVKDRNEFLREAQFTGKLEHPNIVPVHDIGLVATKSGAGNRPFYVMKEIKGDSWQTKIKLNTRGENLEILRRVAEAIDYAHDKQILHCDLKPENVMLGEFGEVLVVDWGQAVDLSRRETYRPGGSPAYISPEMAKYWCDAYLDDVENSLAAKDVGVQSDVYLLGAMLFELITAKPPHYGLKGETAHDVMRSAINNRIVDHEKWLDDELMQIARHALRIDPSVSYETVAEFQDALKSYETRRISIELRDRAMRLLDEAKEKNDYDAYGKARFGFEESLEKWEENDLARTGLSDARLSCAELALQDQNFDLGIGMLEDPETKDEVTLRKKLVTEKSRRDRRKKMVRFLSYGLVLAGLGGAVLLFWGVLASREAQDNIALAESAKAEVVKRGLELKDLEDQGKKLKSDLEDEREEIKAQKNIAKVEREKAAAEREKAAAERKKADTAKLAASEAQNDQIAAERLKKEAEEREKTATAKAKQALQEAADAQAKNVLLKYKDGIVQIQSSVREGDFTTAKAKLNGADEDTKSSIEWARLKMLTHPESVQILSQDSPIEHANFSRDGKRVAVVSEGQVKVLNSQDLVVISSVDLAGDAVAALSPDGSVLAAAVPMLDAEYGRIFVYQDGQTMLLGSAPSKRITDLQFSPDGTRLLCVGEVDKARKATFKEEELMVYRRGDGGWNESERIQVQLTLGENSLVPGSQPEVTNATFSADGSRILLTQNSMSRNADLNELSKSAHVFIYDQEIGTYIWKATAQSNGVDVAIFSNDEGSEVVGCETKDNVSGLFSWKVDSAVDANSQFGSVAGIVSAGATNRIEKIRTLENRLRSMKLEGNRLLTAGEDRKVSLWDWSNRKLISSYKGHSNAVDLCTFIVGDNVNQPVLISIAAGDNPEVLINDLTSRVSDKDTVLLGKNGDQSLSPSSLFVSPDSSFAVLGHDSGHASIKYLLKDRVIEWDVSAWKRHVLTNQYLFAQTGNNDIFRYDRKSGEIKSVLRKIGESIGEYDIVKLQISNDGKIALIETSSAELEFQIWDLTSQTLLNRVRYDSLIPAGAENRDKKKLPNVRLSADGKFVVAGKVGFAVWSTESGSDSPIFNKFGGNRDIDWPLNPINNIVFYANDAGECEFAVSWPEEKSNKSSNNSAAVKGSGRIHVYVKRGDSVELVDRIRPEITQGFFDPSIKASEPNMFGARMIDGSRYLLVRSSDSIDLLKLEPSDSANAGKIWGGFDKVTSFPDASFSKFSDKNNDVLILNRTSKKEVAGKAAATQRWNSEKNQLEKLDLTEKLAVNFPEFPSRDLDFISEASDGSVTVQSLVRGKRDKTRRVYNTLTVKADFSIAPLRVLANPPVKYAATAQENILTLDCGTIRKWKLVERNGAQLIQPSGSLPGFYLQCQVSPDGTQLLVIERVTGRTLVIAPSTGKVILDVAAQPRDSEARPTAVAWSQDQQQLAVGFNNGELRIVNLSDGKMSVDEAQQPVKTDASIKSLAFAEASNSLFVILEDAGNGYNGRVYHYDVKANNWFPVSIGYPVGDQTIEVGHLSPNGNRVVTGSNTGQLTFWNTTKFEIVDATQSGAVDKQQVEQRELLDLYKYPSEARFVKFFANPKNNGRLDIISADKGGVSEMSVNEMEIWKTDR